MNRKYKTGLSALLLMLGLATATAHARTPWDDLGDAAPRSVFDDLGESAPRSVYDELRDTAPVHVEDPDIGGLDSE